MPRSDPKSVALEFNERINARDLDGLMSLMTEAHSFIDAAGRCIEGREACGEAWRRFFESFPDYSNHFESVAVHDDAVTVIGRSTCSDPRLEGGAIWTAPIRGERVSEWRVYHDTAPKRAALGIPA